MNKLILIFLFGIIYVSASEIQTIENIQVRRQIIDSYMEGSPKELFKVFHFLFKKPYALNSETALKKYNVFKKNLNFIKEQNAKKRSWTLEVNFFADLTKEERKAYTGVKPLDSVEVTIKSIIGDKKFAIFDSLVGTEKDKIKNSSFEVERISKKNFDFFDQFADKKPYKYDAPKLPKDIIENNKFDIFDSLLAEKTQKRKLYDFDFFDKYAEAKPDNHNDPKPPKSRDIVLKDEIDHIKHLSEVRDQGSCEAGWAMATTMTVEALYNMNYSKEGTDHVPQTSVQQIIDCVNSEEYGCTGGWMSDAYKYLSQIGSVLDIDYPYKETDEEVCTAEGKNIAIKLNATEPFIGCSNYGSYFGVEECTEDSWYEYLKAGPVAVVVNADDDEFAFYKSGIIDSSELDCETYDHAITAYAWKIEDATKPNSQYIVLRNSWGTAWGEEGDIKYYYNEENGTCWITKMAFQPVVVIA